jgi:hypothetical protein
MGKQDNVNILMKNSNTTSTLYRRKSIASSVCFWRQTAEESPLTANFKWSFQFQENRLRKKNFPGLEAQPSDFAFG